jgi:single-stranded-DNA-specific exonuclease
VRNENLPALKQRLIDIAAMQLGGLDLQPSIEIDAAIPLSKVNGKLIRTLSSLAPFGVSNPEPVFLSREVEVADVKVMGSDGTHLRLVLKDGRARWAAVAFGKAHHEVEIGQRLDVVYTFSADNRDGAIELRLEDFAPSA